MRRSLKGWLLWLHKWIGIGLGIIVFLWLVSGMIMILPNSPPPRTRQPPVDYHDVTLSPSQATELVARDGGDSTEVRKLTLVPVLDRSCYLVETASRRAHLVDARTAELLTITPELAEQIARRAGGSDAPISGVTKLTRHDLGYFRGPLPTYRVDFADDRQTSVFVSPRDGSVRYTTRWQRARLFMSGLHTFDQVELLPGADGSRKPLLHFTSILGIALVLSGYYLVLPRSWRTWPRRPPASRAPSRPPR